MPGRVRLQEPFAIVPEGLIFSGLTDRAVRMWMMLARIAQQADACMPNRKWLSERLGCSLDSVDRAARELSEAGWVAVESGQRDGTANTYLIRTTLPTPPAPSRTPVPAGGAAPVRPPAPEVAGQNGAGAANGGHPQPAAPLPHGSGTPAAPVRHPSSDELEFIDTGEKEQTPPSPPTGGIPPHRDAELAAAVARSDELEARRQRREAAAKRTKRKTRLPADWLALTDDQRAYCAQRAPHVDPAVEFERFRAHHDSNGSLKADWPATWRTWVGNISTFTPPSRAVGGRGVYTEPVSPQPLSPDI